MGRFDEKNRVGQVLVLLGLIVAGVICRVCFRGIPNFMPVAGMALFAGYYFRSRAWGLLVPFAIMGISDLFLQGYNWQMRTVVYGAMLLPVGFGAMLRWWTPMDSRSQNLWGTAAGMIGCSLASSVLFFLLTNFAWWPWSNMYEKTFEDLLGCYAAGLPFFKYTLAGDLFFASALFGGYAAILNSQVVLEEEGSKAKAIAE